MIRVQQLRIRGDIYHGTEREEIHINETGRPIDGRTSKASRRSLDRGDVEKEEERKLRDQDKTHRSQPILLSIHILHRDRDMG